MIAIIPFENRQGITEVRSIMEIKSGTHLDHKMRKMTAIIPF